LSGQHQINKRVVYLAAAIFISLLIVTVLAVTFWQQPSPEGKLYSIPVVVGDNTYAVSVLSNYSSAPEVSYWEEGKAVYVAFIGDKEDSFFNVTIPTDLIWGELTLVDKYYEVSQDRYIQSFNGTHNSVYFTFNHSAYVKHFEVRGTEGASIKQAS